EVEVGFRPVVGHIDLAMLIRAHRARIDVEIGTELPDTHTETSRLQQGCKRSGHQALAKRGDHAAGDENIPRHGRGGLAFYKRVGQARESPRTQKRSIDRRKGQLASGTAPLEALPLPTAPATPASGSALPPAAGACCGVAGACFTSEVSMLLGA